jgi:hypothetical protein
LLNNGQLWDYFDQTKAVKFEASNVKQASAGVGFDAVLYKTGWLADVNPSTATTKAWVKKGNVASASAGLDRDGLPMIAYVDTTTHAYEWRLGKLPGVSWTESLGAGILQVSAGRNGVVAELTVPAFYSQKYHLLVNVAFNHYDAAYAALGGAFTTPGTTKTLAIDLITAVSAGTDCKGNAMTDALFSTHKVKEFSDTWGVKDLETGWLEVDAGIGGISDLVSPGLGGVPSGFNDIWRYQDACGSQKGSWTLLVQNDLS